MTGSQLTKGTRPRLRGDRATGGCRVLLVVGNDQEARQLSRFLSTAKPPIYSVVRASSVNEGLAAVTAERPDVVVLDLALPGLWGRRADHLIPSFTDTAAVTVLVSAEDASAGHEALRFDAQDFLVKESITPDTLERSIRYARERYRLMRVHQRSDQRFRGLVTDDPDAALVIDMQGDLLFANPAAAKLFPELKKGELVTKYGFHVPGPMEEPVTIDDEHTVEVRRTRIEWEARPAWLVQLRDVSAQVQIADLKARLSQSEKLAVIGQLAAGVAHEINNPLAFILANLSATLGHIHHVDDAVGRAVASGRNGGDSASMRTILEQVGPDLFGELKEMLEDNLDGVDRIRTIVRELKTFSRQEGEERELVRINDLVKSTCRMVASQIRHRAVLVKDLHDVKPVTGNRVKLVQILTNLLMNAAQALPDHRGRQERIEIRTRQSDRWIIISVSDTGTGVDEEVRDRIFEPFFTTKPREVGTGIGLSLSAELARQHDGELVLVETSPHGSTFELRLPAVDSVRLVHSAQQPAAVRNATVALGRRRILLIDDEPNVRKSMTRMLRSYDVTAKPNGREGLTALQNACFDAVICDLVMPDLDGVDVHEAISHSHPELIERTIFTSGGAYTPRTAAFVAKHEIIFVEKPIHPRQLLGMLEDLFRKDDADPALS